jgi:hypothetical protein
MYSCEVSPKQKRIREFVRSKISPHLDRDADTSEFEDVVESVSEFIGLCLTGQGEFSIFQREEQAQKTPRSE